MKRKLRPLINCLYSLIQWLLYVYLSNVFCWEFSRFYMKFTLLSEITYLLCFFFSFALLKGIETKVSKFPRCERAWPFVFIFIPWNLSPGYLHPRNSSCINSPLVPCCDAELFRFTNDIWSCLYGIGILQASIFFFSTLPNSIRCKHPSTWFTSDANMS